MLEAAPTCTEYSASVRQKAEDVQELRSQAVGLVYLSVQDFLEFRWVCGNTASVAKLIRAQTERFDVIGASTGFSVTHVEAV